MNHFQNYLTNLTTGDVIHFFPANTADDPLPRTGRIHAITDDGFNIETEPAVYENVPLARIQHRVSLPWKPIDQHDYLIVFSTSHSKCK